MMQISIGSRGSGLGSKLGASFFFLFFLGLGSVFCWLLAQALVAELGSFGWKATDCRIEDSRGLFQAEAGGLPHRFEVRYRYVFAGREITGKRLRLRNPHIEDAARLERLLDRYPAGSIATCYVDPQRPTSAVLERPIPWWGLFLLLPLLFVAIGVSGLYGTWRPERHGEKRQASLRRKERLARSLGGRGSALSANPTQSGAGCLVLFFGLFAVAGGLMTGVFFVRPALQTLQARDWPEVPCTVVSSNVGSSSSDDGTTYSVAVLYTYEIAGRTYHSNRFQFLGGSSSGYEHKAKIVARYPPGSQTTCRVDPEDPTRAVISTTFGRDYLFGLIPLLFFAVGVGGMGFAGWFGIRSRRNPWQRNPKRQRSQSASPAPSGGAYDPGAAIDLRGGGRAKQLVGTVVVCLIWNGITGLFVYKIVEEWAAGRQPWFLTLFLTPFLLIGLLILLGVPYAVLALFNPRFALTLEGGLAVGGSTTLHWKARGRVRRIGRWRIELEGTEKATARPIEMERGSTTVTLPADTMHSFDSGSNQIVWTLCLHGEIPFWPNLKDCFEITVAPAPVEAAPVEAAPVETAPVDRGSAR
jgi:hypothetical protein